MGQLLSDFKRLEDPSIALYTYNNEVYVEKGIWCWIKLQLCQKLGITYFGDYHFDKVIETAKTIDGLGRKVIETLNEKIKIFCGKYNEHHIDLLPNNKKSKADLVNENTKLQNQVKQFLKNPISSSNPQPSSTTTTSLTEGLPDEVVSYTVAISDDVTEVTFDQTTNKLFVSPQLKQILDKATYFQSLLKKDWNESHSLTREEILALADNMNLYLDLDNKNATESTYEKWKLEKNLSKDSTALSLNSSKISTGINEILNNLAMAHETNELSLLRFWENLLCQNFPLRVDYLDLISEINDYMNTFQLKLLGKEIALFLLKNRKNEQVADFIETVEFELPLEAFDESLVELVFSTLTISYYELNPSNDKTFFTLISKLTTNTIHNDSFKENSTKINPILGKASADFTDKIETFIISKICLREFWGINQEMFDAFKNLKTIDLTCDWHREEFRTQLNTLGFFDNDNWMFVKQQTSPLLPLA